MPNDSAILAALRAHFTTGAGVSALAADPPATPKEARMADLRDAVQAYINFLPTELRHAPVRFETLARHCATARGGIQPKDAELSQVLRGLGFEARKTWAGGRGRWVWALRRPID